MTERKMTSQPEAEPGLRFSVDYDVSLPPSMAAEVFQDAGDVYVVATNGGLFLQNGAGNVTLYEVEGDVRAHLDAGDISAALALPRHGAIDLGTRSGRVGLSIPEDTSADLLAVANRGQIQISNLELTGTSEAAGSSLSGTLGSGEGHIGLWTLAGDIEVAGY